MGFKKWWNNLVLWKKGALIGVITAVLLSFTKLVLDIIFVGWSKFPKILMLFFYFLILKILFLGGFSALIGFLIQQKEIIKKLNTWKKGTILGFAIWLGYTTMYVVVFIVYHLTNLKSITSYYPLWARALDSTLFLLINWGGRFSVFKSNCDDPGCGFEIIIPLIAYLIILPLFGLIIGFILSKVKRKGKA